MIPLLVRSAPQHEFIILSPSIRDKASSDHGQALEIVVPDATPIRQPVFTAALEQRIPPSRHSRSVSLAVSGPARRPERAAVAPLQAVVTLHDLIWLDHQHAHQVDRNWLAAESFRRLALRGIPHTLRAATT